jgi:hypothetical protein
MNDDPTKLAHGTHPWRRIEVIIGASGIIDDRPITDQRPEFRDLNSLDSLFEFLQLEAHTIFHTVNLVITNSAITEKSLGSCWEPNFGWKDTAAGSNLELFQL